MNPTVIDASILVKLFLNEEHSDAAIKWFVKTPHPQAPDFIWTEVANVVWKCFRRGEYSNVAAIELIGDMMKSPIQIYPSRDLLLHAAQLAVKHKRSVYDCLYLALAAETQSAMVTNDLRLVNALKGTIMEKHVIWIGNL